MVEAQWSLTWRAGLRRADERAVEVGQEPVPQGDGVADELEDGVPPRPRVLIDVPDLRMVAAEGRQCPVLHPADEQLGGGVTAETADVGADERLARYAQPPGHRHAQP